MDIHFPSTRSGSATSRSSRTSRGRYDPDLFGRADDIAETYYAVAQQPKHGWSNEIDIRPYRETWSC
ncbi:hypothetical protein T492DRAFT_882099 [Pavlovales sp. CCMP2436]|nr:hypothetical protein T492DRAFT_882099 [Pavlovales sp. CCMP2436]